MSDSQKIKIDFDNVISANESGEYHEKVWATFDKELDCYTDLYNQPISDNPTGDHGHVWNINHPPLSGIPDGRPAEQYGGHNGSHKQY